MDQLEKIDEKIDALKDSTFQLDKNLSIIAQQLFDHLAQDSINLGKINSSLESIDKALDIYNRELSVHIQGVQAAQENNAILREELELSKKEYNTRLEALERPKAFREDLKNLAILWAKILSGAAAFVGAMIALYRLFH